MEIKKSFEEFVATSIDYDRNNLDSIKELIRLAIRYYQLKSFENVEENIIYIASVAEENMLSKIAEIAVRSGDEDIAVIESIYEGKIVRCY